MRDGIAATTSAPVSDPARRDSPPLSEFFGSQNFKEGTVAFYVLCSGLCSSGFHIFPVNNLQCMAVRRTALRHWNDAGPCAKWSRVLTISAKRFVLAGPEGILKEPRNIGKRQ
jgi:hypothetical protein